MESNDVSHSYECRTRSNGSIVDPSKCHPDDLIDGTVPIFARVATNMERSKLWDLNDPATVKDFPLDAERIVQAKEEGVRTVLTTPIFNQFSDEDNRKIIGAIVVVNNVNNEKSKFTGSDLVQLDSLGLFAGVGISNAAVYERSSHLMSRQLLAIELLSYHTLASDSDAEALVNSDILTAEDYKLFNWEFNDAEWNDFETCQMALSMFDYLDLNLGFHIDDVTLARFIISIRKNYRMVKYHNWRHAFNVCHTIFWILTSGRMLKYFDGLQQLALLCATLAHDLDHRGTTNAFQVRGRVFVCVFGF